MEEQYVHTSKSESSGAKCIWEVNKKTFLALAGERQYQTALVYMAATDASNDPAASPVFGALQTQ